jgi:splicing factor 1
VVVLPREEHPGINFRKRFLKEKGEILRAMEKETGAMIVLRGSGLAKEKRCKDGQPFLGEDEPLQAVIMSKNEESLMKAVGSVRDFSRILKLKDVDSNFRCLD